MRNMQFRYANREFAASDYADMQDWLECINLVLDLTYIYIYVSA